MTITIENKRVVNKLSKLSHKKHKNIEQIIIELVDNYEYLEENNTDFTNKYKKLNPLEHSTLLKFEESELDDDLDNIKPFENVEDTAKFAKELREKSWKWFF